MSTSPSSLASRRICDQCCWPAAARAIVAARTSSPASGASPWSLVTRPARNASSAQYCRKMCTGLPSAAAPAVITAADCSLSSVPEKSTTESGCSIWLAPYRKASFHCSRALADRGGGQADQASLHRLPHQGAGADNVGVSQPVLDLATPSLGEHQPAGAHQRQVLRDVRLAHPQPMGEAAHV